MNVVLSFPLQSDAMLIDPILHPTTTATTAHAAADSNTTD